jgi:hypothetical protein
MIAMARPATPRSSRQHSPASNLVDWQISSAMSRSNLRGATFHGNADRNLQGLQMHMVHMKNQGSALFPIMARGMLQL